MIKINDFTIEKSHKIAFRPVFLEDEVGEIPVVVDAYKCVSPSGFEFKVRSLRRAIRFALDYYHPSLDLPF